MTLSIVPQPPQQNVVVFYEGRDPGGNTSIAHEATDLYKWSGQSAYAASSWGYFKADGQEVPYIKRDRDLGQTFAYTGTAPKTLTSITVSTGYGTDAVRQGMYGQTVSLQLFEVVGSPVWNRNGSDSTTEAFHGFPHNRPGDNIPHERDDYFTGEKYVSIGVFTGAVFPDKVAFGFASNATDIDPNHQNLKGRYLRFQLPAAGKIVLQPGKTYAFLVMIDKMGKDYGFTLANHYYGKYPGGHGIRRDGNGVFPPVPPDPSKDFKDPANRKAYESAHFPTDMQKRTAIPPGTNGYPDVDTWRDLQFYIEAK
ncbi:MAG: hypothetical protein MUD08_02050 [Cytophagales bacterium]|nr:hypothetical protein [Cytophagales bacterium]